MRIGVVGQKKAGKSLLAYKFSRYLGSKGVGAKFANFDVLLKHASYKPDFDLRRYYRSEPLEAYAQAFKDDPVKEAVAESTWVLDFSSGLDWLWFGSTQKFCDVFLLVVNEPEVKYVELARLLSAQHAVPFVLVVNCSIAFASSQQTLSAYTLPKTKAFANAVLVNAEEREGFDELWETIRALVKS